MIKDVIINIKGTQGSAEDTDTIEFTTDGRFGTNGGKYYLSYNEGPLFDNDIDVKTQIIINSEDSVLLQRSGSFKSKLLIEKGKRNSCFYSTPHGDLVIGIFGDSFDFKLDDSGGKIKLKYTIDSNLQIISKNEVNISIREVKNNVNTCS